MGEKEEQVEELKADIVDMKALYRNQINDLMERIEQLSSASSSSSSSSHNNHKQATN